ncbi:cytochrome P450 [Stackebrandtia nassauensis]|uniref:Cytochrome P450 n=1 Tax=Stackebrandtia nassauensis (strain DSM 44728 / CIP 108903 / NRRL B-16338 / NBRC 102104 / LLR-40K-21) TaxID=446470 RepID=D3QAH9_STANL|nr:cytochrome P450 [Stackebrandtia nassauensis]ADD42762.1 cytochrome P450 [Stackebrandtia nassauensis DSM 44728]
MKRFPRLTTTERLQVTLLNTLPAFARGIAIARPKTVSLLNRLQVDRRMVDLFDRLRERYRGLPVWISSVNGPTLLLLSPRHVERVLGGSDQLYTPDTKDKHRALGVFQPHGVIVSRGELRVKRRQFNEAILDTSQPAHAERYARIVAAEIDAMMTGPGRDGTLIWPEIKRAFDCVARRVVLGDGAREDVDSTRLLAKLRREANSLGAKPGTRRRVAAWKADWDNRLARYAESAPADSLIGRVTDTYAETEVRPLGQVTQWLTALDMVPVLAARTLALLASHPEHFARANEELAAADAHHGASTAASIAAQPYLQACVMEAARLWPAVPNLARATTRPLDWDGVILKTGTTMVIPALYHARSRRQGRFAHRFTPERWLDGGLDRDWTIMPFSLGPARCAGAMLGGLLATAGCAALLRQAYVRLNTPRLAPDKPLPMAMPVTDISLAVGAKPVTPAPVATASGASASGQ